MAALRCMSRRLCRQFRAYSTSIAQERPKLSSDSDSCFLLTFHGKIRYPGDRFIALDNFFEEVPLLEHVRAERLIEKVNIQNPYDTSTRIRKLLRTGLLPLYIAKRLSVSIPEAYREGNVGVLSGVEVFAFKELDVKELVAEENLNSFDGSGYDQFLIFFKQIVSKYVGEEALSCLPGGFGKLLEDLENPKRVENDDQLAYHSCFFPNTLLATMFFEFHRLLREELPARGLGETAEEILQAIDSHHPNFLTDCAGNPLIRKWAGVHGIRSPIFGNDLTDNETLGLGENEEGKMFSSQLLNALDSIKASQEGDKDIELGDLLDSHSGAEKRDKKGKKGIPKHEGFNLKVHNWKRRYAWLKGKQRLMESHLLGALGKRGILKDVHLPSIGQKEPPDKMKTPPVAKVTDTHRHGSVHPVETETVDLVEELPEYNRASLEEEPFQVEDVVKLFTHKFPDYPDVTVKAFHKHQIWEKLQLRKQFPFPSILCPKNEN